MMNDLELEELISAYVDGELTGDEQSQVERALQQSPRCRRVHDEFVAVRATLQSLPREQLDPDFTRRVLDRISRAARPVEALGSGNGQLTNGQLTNGQLTNGQLTNGQLTNGQLTNGQLTNGQLTGSLSAALAPTAIAGASSADRSELRRVRWVRHPATWSVAAAATVLLTIALAPNHLGLPLGDGEHGTIGAGLEGGNAQNEGTNGIEIPLVGPDSALAGTEAEANSGTNEQPPPQTVSNDADGSPRPSEDTSPTLVQDPPTPSEPKDPSSLSTDPPLENEPSPQIARATPVENEPASTIPGSAPAIPLAEFVINYAVNDLHVVRLAVSPEAMRSRAFDEILEQEGISFRVAGARPEARGNGDRPNPEIDVLLVRGGVAQLDGVLAALKKSPDDFRPLAVYTAPQDRILDLLVKVVESFPSTTGDPAPAPSGFPGAEDLLPAPAELLELSTGGLQKIFAWRASHLSLEVLDELFPVPDRNVAKKAPVESKIEPGQTAQVMFILFRGK